MRHLFPLMLAGCGGSLLTLDAEEVDTRLDRLEASVPHCRDIVAAGRGAPSTGTLHTQVSAVGTGSTGTCGGEAQVEWNHEDGDTDYTAIFDTFCMNSSSGDVVVNGEITAHEEGTPSDEGPVVESLDVATDGPLDVELGGSQVAVDVRGLQTTYGVPQAWSPGEPTTASPDVTTLDRATLTWADGTVDYAEDFQLERTGLFPASIVIERGRLGTEGEGYVDVSTRPGEPLLVSSTGMVQGGSIVLTGRGGTEVVLTPRPDAAGLTDVVVDGVAHPRNIDCTGGLAPSLEMALALTAAFPIY